MSAPPRLTPRNLVDLLSRPRWCAGMLGTPRRIVGHAPGVSGIASMADWATDQFDATLTWKDVEWVRRLWKGKLILKGILVLLSDLVIASKAIATAIVGICN